MNQKKLDTELPHAAADFFKENENTSGKKSGGPYNENDRNHRRQEVYRLHFELGISALKIAEMMEVNRNTINSDIRFWYSTLEDEWKKISIKQWIMKQINRLEDQRSRLLEELEKQESASQKISIERLLLEIETRISHIMMKASSQWILA